MRIACLSAKYAKRREKSEHISFLEGAIWHHHPGVKGGTADNFSFLFVISRVLFTWMTGRRFHFVSARNFA
jgi:uncharacterized MAPEG superfamily protein